MTPHASEAEKALAEVLDILGTYNQCDNPSSAMACMLHLESMSGRFVQKHGPALLAEVEALRKAAMPAEGGEAHTCDFTDGLDKDCPACHPPAAPANAGVYVIGDDDYILRIGNKWFRGRRHPMLTPEQFVALSGRTGEAGSA